MKVKITIVIAGFILTFSCSGILKAMDIITLDRKVIVTTDNYEIEFDSGVINHITNKLTNEDYSLLSGLTGNTGILNRQSGSVWANQLDIREIEHLKVGLIFSQGQNRIVMFISVDPVSGDLLIEQEGISEARGVYGIQWGCGNLDIQKSHLIIPVLGGQVIDDEFPFSSQVFTYPGSGQPWEAQLAIIQGLRGGFYVRSEDDTFQFKALNYNRDAESYALGFETHNQSPYDNLTSAKSVVWRINTYIGDWRVPASIYCDWMERALDPRLISTMPSWVGDIGLVVTYLADYRDFNLLDKLAGKIDAAKTLLYLPDWRKDGYDVNYPDYIAKAELGDFIKYAHQLRFRIMLHTNIYGIAPYNTLYDEFKSSQIKEPFSKEPLGWWWDRTQAPQRHAFIDLADSRFRKLFVQKLKEVWSKYHVDAFHLDVSSFIINDANGLIEGLNSAQGNAQMHKELAESLPQVIFSGEGLSEVTFFRESFAQRWKLSPGMKPHPICAFLFSRYTMPYGYLGMPNPDSSPVGYQKYLDSYESWGVLPTLSLSSVDQLEKDGARNLLAIAKLWQQSGLKPDFDDDWENDTLFKYTGQSGEIAAYQKTEGGSRLVLPHETRYERAYGITQVVTDLSIPDWYAYNEIAIIGLDPEQYYLLSDLPRDYSKFHINSLPEGIFITEARVTKNAAFFKFERSRFTSEIDLISRLYLARLRTVINDETLYIQKGASFQATEALASGIQKLAIFAHPPWQGVIGDVFGEFNISLPDSPGISLEFDIALADGSENSDGVTFMVHVNGNEIFHRHYNEQKWQHFSLDLNAYRNQQIILRFTTNPGPQGNTGWDWAVWGEPKIFAEPDKSFAKIGFFSPDTPVMAYPDNIRYSGQGQYFLETRLPVALIMLFEPVQLVKSPYNLRNAQFIAGLQYGGIFKIGSVWGSGNLTGGTSGGISKETIFAHPPSNGKTVIQFPLRLPNSREIVFSFSMGLEDGSCSDGLDFSVLINGEPKLEHFTETPGWTNANISLTGYAGQIILLELVTAPHGEPDCDWAHWADLFITAKGVLPDWDINSDAVIDFVDIVDLVKSLGKLSSESPKKDVNHDGMINILDLIIIAKHFGENYREAQ